MTANEGDLWLDRSDARLRGRRDGLLNAPSFLLIHEMGGTLNSWDAVVAAVGTDWACVRSDLRGCGQSSLVAGTVQLDALVEDQLAICDAAAVHGPMSIVASAIGAAIAVAFAAQHPERVSRLILLTPALGIPAERREGARAIADRIEAEGVEPFLRQTLDAAYPLHLRAPSAFDAFLATQLANDAVSFAAYWRMLADLDLSREVASLSMPIHILTGSADNIRRPEKVERLPGARFDIVESGHFMAMQTPKIVADAIKASLSTSTIHRKEYRHDH